MAFKFIGKCHKVLVMELMHGDIRSSGCGNDDFLGEIAPDGRLDKECSLGDVKTIGDSQVKDVVIYEWGDL